MDQYLLYKASDRQDVKDYKWPAYDFHRNESKLIDPFLPHPSQMEWKSAPKRTDFMYPQHVRDQIRKVYQYPTPRCHSFQMCKK